MNRVTVFTPTYNRGYVIHKLIDSLLRQTVFDFSWLVIDDGSDDNTEEIFSKLSESEMPFEIRYTKVLNGGKQRAINRAVSLIDTEYTFIVDSDDYLVPDAMEKVLSWINDKGIDDSFAGVSGVKGTNTLTSVGNRKHRFSGGYVDATNLERRKYGLELDMAEVYKTEILRRYPFEVFENEKYVPEATVWDRIALDGYKLRWHQDIIYICEYLDDGLTKGSWRLLKNNPVGYAKLFDMQLLTNNKGKWKICIQMVCCLILAKRWIFIFKSNNPFRAVLCTPAAYFLSLRRKSQFRKYIK